MYFGQYSPKTDQIKVNKINILFTKMEGKHLWVSESYIKQFIGKDGENLHWTTDLNSELPVVMEESGAGALPPTTFVSVLAKAAQNHPLKPALKVKRDQRWLTWSFKAYWEDSMRFSRAMINIGVGQRSATNIIGFNSPEWVISFAGSLLSNCVPVGVYTTNGPEACQYIAEHSECKLVIVENTKQLKKYLKVWDSLPNLKAVVVYTPDSQLDSMRKGREVYTWEEFMGLGSDSDINEVESRIKAVKPTSVATIVYTSGTTGPPKGVLLSHDNYMWTATECLKLSGLQSEDERIVSYLPLSHSAAQIIDIFGSLSCTATVFFADEKALQGTLGITLKEVRPTFFFGVPRVYEKIEQKIKEIAANNSPLKKSIGNWAKTVGYKNTLSQISNKPTDLSYKLARVLVFSKVKENLGLDHCKVFLVGAAPISKSTLEFFASLNIPIFNAYGMSESAAPTTINLPHLNNLWSAGFPIPGTHIKILDSTGAKLSAGQKGEVCFRGRNKFMGYYKNKEATKTTIDANGFIHSGDEGYLDEQGFLFITGRFKELIITAGGENIPPVLIEDSVKAHCTIISNAFVVGDNRKFLAMLVSLKTEASPEGEPTDQLALQVLNALKEIGSSASTLEEATTCPEVKKWVQKAIDETNSKATSRAQHIRKWTFITKDFSIAGGELTPTMKVKRNVVNEKYSDLIEKFYLDPAL